MSGAFRVVIIRHAEKPAAKGNIHLSPAGRKRAAMLAKKIPKRYRDIVALFATKKSKGSNRPIETITPLSQALALPINDEFAQTKWTSLATYILARRALYAGNTVFVSWHHESIPKLIADLGVVPEIAKIPEDVYDRIWQIHFPGTGAPKLKIKDQPKVG